MMATGRPGRFGKAGFTLVELLVGLTILSAMALVALPVARNAFGASQLETAAADLASAARMTRAAALRDGAERHLLIDASARRYWADGVVGQRTLPDSLALAMSIPPGEQSDGRVQRIRFLASGGSSGGRLVLSQGKRSLAVTIDWLTGAPHVTR